MFWLPLLVLVAASLAQAQPSPACVGSVWGNITPGVWCFAYADGDTGARNFGVLLPNAAAPPVLLPTTTPSSHGNGAGFDGQRRFWLGNEANVSWEGGLLTSVDWANHALNPPLPFALPDGYSCSPSTCQVQTSNLAVDEHTLYLLLSTVPPSWQVVVRLPLPAVIPESSAPVPALLVADVTKLFGADSGAWVLVPGVTALNPRTGMFWLGAGTSSDANATYAALGFATRDNAAGAAAAAAAPVVLPLPGTVNLCVGNCGV